MDGYERLRTFLAHPKLLTGSSDFAITRTDKTVEHTVRAAVKNFDRSISRIGIAPVRGGRMEMTIREGNAIDVLLFGAGDEELVDIKCFRGDRENVSAKDIERQIQDGILQHKMHPNRASSKAPTTGVEMVNVVEFVKRLPIAA